VIVVVVVPIAAGVAVAIANLSMSEDAPTRASSTPPTRGRRNRDPEGT
jgi:hypothetical protein